MSKNLSDIYAMSTDYELLWKLINEGYELPIIYMTDTGRMMAGKSWKESSTWHTDTNGGWGFESFLVECRRRQVRFIPPTKPRFEWVRDEDGGLVCKYNDHIRMVVYTASDGLVHWWVRGFDEPSFGIKPTEQESQTAAETRLIELITPKA